MATLYDSIAYGAGRAKNRLAMAPMLTTVKEIDGFPTEWHEEYYRLRAADGAGLIIVECTAVDRGARNSPGELGLYKDGHIEGMRRVAGAIREGGALAVVQIHHAGRATPANVSDSPLGVSAETLPDGRAVRGMSGGEAEECVAQFAQAAARARAAGFDGIELHGCHGYLIDQFVSPATNRRDDRWGGETISARLAFSRAVIEAVRAATAPAFIIGYRMGYNDPDGAAGVEIGKALESFGVDYLSVSGGIGPQPMPDGADGAHGFWIAARDVKRAVSVPVIGVNTIHTLGSAEKVVQSGYMDVAAVARPYLLNADWMRAQQEGRSLVECRKCKGGCYYLRGKCPYLSLPS